MKKFFLTLLCAGILAFSITGCGFRDALDVAAEEAKATEPTTIDTNVDPTATQEDEIKSTDYKNTIEGLHEYFVAKEYITEKSTQTTMEASLLGAEKGVKYTISNNLAIEFYEFDTKNLNETAKGIINSVKENGTFTILDLSPVNAYISDNGKYLMVYSDSNIKEDKTTTAVYVQRENAIKDFEAFHK